MQLSWYIAEFYNTLTNLAMIVPGLYGMYTTRKHHLERRWDFFISNMLFLFLSLIDFLWVIWCCLWWVLAQLYFTWLYSERGRRLLIQHNICIPRFWGQMMDELPMVYSSCAFIYSLKLVGNILVVPLNLDLIFRLRGRNESRTSLLWDFSSFIHFYFLLSTWHFRIPSYTK